MEKRSIALRFKFYGSLREQLEKTTIRLAALQEAEDNYYVTAKHLLELTQRAYSLFVISEIEKKRQLLKLTLSNLRVEGKKVLYEPIKPFTAILNVDGIGKISKNLKESWKRPNLKLHQKKPRMMILLTMKMLRNKMNQGLLSISLRRLNLEK